jgi:Flp pilus assembly protein TadG
MIRLRHLRRDERGASLLYITTGFMAFFAATALAIDVGMLMTARGQAQTAADAGALAGAVALAVDDFDDRSATGPAVLASINTALENSVLGADVDVQPADVTFPVAPSGEANRVRVAVFRTSERNNPLTTFIMSVFGMPQADISARATAEAAPANAMSCVKPFTIPDRWTENQDPPWTPASTYDRYDNHGNLLPDADQYIPRGQPGYNGYDAEQDKGLLLTIRAGTGNEVNPSFYWSWSMPDVSGTVQTGSDWYRENIANCNDYVAHLDELMTAEPGNIVGPTIQGIEDLIAKDPTAYWDDDCNCVHSQYGLKSPRVFPIPLYDPEYYAYGVTQGRNADLKMANWLGFFVEGNTGNEIYGRITPILGIIDGDAGPSPDDGVFPRAVRLVE